MPFAGYADFADCVRQNSDKATPEAFCAWLEHKVTGLWPSQSSMPEAAWALYVAAYAEKIDAGATQQEAINHAQSKLDESGWQQTRFGYLKQFEAPKMRNVTGVKVFAVGSWTDSAGIQRSWSEQDLLNMVSAFNAGIPSVVALKAGHTSDEFNSAIAEAMDVPIQLIIGEAGGNGQVSLGKMSTLELKGSLLVAAFERVPEAVADLIDSGMYSTVSAEIEDQIGDFGPVLTGVALLGAETPAVDEATLDRAMVFGGPREGAHVLTFTIDATHGTNSQLQQEFVTLKDKMQGVIKGMKGAPIFRALMNQLDGLFNQIVARNNHQAEENANQYQQGEHQMDEEQLKKLAASLGLGEEATFDDVMAAIDALAKKVAETPPPTQPEQSAENMAAMTNLKEQVKALQHKDLVNQYAEKTRGLNAIEGKPDDLAEQLAVIEETHGKEAADNLLSHYHKANDLNKRAIQYLGTEIRIEGQEPAEDHDFVKEVRQYAEDNKVSYQVALAKMATKEPAKYAAYRRATKVEVQAI